MPVSRVTSIGIATVVNLRDRTNQLHKSIKMAAKLSVIKNKREKKNKQTQTTKKKKKKKKDHSDITTHTLTQLHLF